MPTAGMTPIARGKCRTVKRTVGVSFGELGKWKYNRTREKYQPCRQRKSKAKKRSTTWMQFQSEPCSCPSARQRRTSAACSTFQKISGTALEMRSDKRQGLAA